MAAVARGAGGRLAVAGMAELQAGLKVAQVKMAREMGRAHRKVAAVVAGRAKQAAPGGTASAIRPVGNKDNAVVRIGPAPGRAIGTFMGAKGRFGWYAAGRYAGSQGRQFKPHVGNQWVPGEQGGRPYHIGDAINAATEEAEKVYLDEIERMHALAFPLKTG
jgi:hypothetical protein